MTLKKSFIALAAAAVLTAGGIAAQATGRGPFAAQRAKRFEFLAMYLDLTDAQKAQAKSIMQASSAQNQALVDQLKQGHQAMVAAVKANKPEADLQQIAGAQAPLIAQLAVRKALMAEQLWAMLTPEQQAKADKLHSRFLNMAEPGQRLEQ